MEVGEAASAASVESSPISVGKGTPKENRDSGHESSATSTPDAERAMTPGEKLHTFYLFLKPRFTGFILQFFSVASWNRSSPSVDY